MKSRAFFTALLTAGSLLASQPLVAQTTASNPGLDEEAVLPGTQIKGEIWNAVEVLEDLLALPEDGIPPALLRNAHGLVVIPSMIKLGWMIGGRHGSGVAGRACLEALATRTKPRTCCGSF